MRPVFVSGAIAASWTRRTTRQDRSTRSGLTWAPPPTSGSRPRSAPDCPSAACWPSRSSPMHFLQVLADQQAARVGPAAVGREPLTAQADGPALRASRWPRIRSRAARSITICAGRSAVHRERRRTPRPTSGWRPWRRRTAHPRAGHAMTLPSMTARTPGVLGPNAVSRARASPGVTRLSLGRLLHRQRSVAPCGPGVKTPKRSMSQCSITGDAKARDDTR